MPQITPHSRVVSKLAPEDGKRTRYTFIGIKGLQLDCIPDGTPLGNRFWRVRYYVDNKQIQWRPDDASNAPVRRAHEKRVRAALHALRIA